MGLTELAISSPQQATRYLLMCTERCAPKRGAGKGIHYHISSSGPTSSLVPAGDQHPYLKQFSYHPALCPEESNAVYGDKTEA